MKKNLFPVFFDITDRKCLVVGGGIVAERKAADLLECDAQVILVSPQATPEIAKWADGNFITWRAREFTEEDLEDAFLVFLATDNSCVNQRAATLCRERRIPVNAVDDPSNCDFYVPSILRRQSLAIAISTGGKSPLFARKMREELEAVITEAYGEFVEILGEKRLVVQEYVGDIKERKKIYETLVYSDILELLKAGEKEKARERIEQCMSCLQD